MSKRSSYRKSGPGDIFALREAARDRSMQAKREFDSASEIKVTYADGTVEVYDNAYDMRRRKKRKY